MTVCFDFNPQETPWITPFDRYNIRGNPVPDGKISTFDIQSIPSALTNYKATPVHSDDGKLCDAFYVEMVKLGFKNSVLEPQSKNSESIWQDKDYWLEQIRRSQATALRDIDQRQQVADAHGDYHLWECDFMGTCLLNPFDAARDFINCAAETAARSVYFETPIMAGVGIVLEREAEMPPRLDAAEDGQARYLLQKIMGGYGGYAHIGSIDGMPTSSMTDEDIETALSGPEGSYVRLGMIAPDGSAEEICSEEPREIGMISLRRQLSLGTAILECGSIDVPNL